MPATAENSHYIAGYSDKAAPSSLYDSPFPFLRMPLPLNPLKWQPREEENSSRSPLAFKPITH